MIWRLASGLFLVAAVDAAEPGGRGGRGGADTYTFVEGGVCVGSDLWSGAGGLGCRGVFCVPMLSSWMRRF